MISTTGVKSLNLNENTFSYNAAVNGGSIYCDSC